MKFFFLLLSFYFISFSTLARGVGYWVPLSATTETAKNAAEYSVLQRKYPQVFGAYDPATVTLALISITKLQYTGETVCPAGDPRLTVEIQTVEICQNSGSCFQQASSWPSYQDPCGN